jgi:hypothetical protein
MPTNPNGGRKRTKTAARGDRSRPDLPESMWKLLGVIGARIYAVEPDKKVKLQSKYADPIFKVLADGKISKASALKKQAIVAYRDFLKANDLIKFAP